MESMPADPTHRDPSTIEWLMGTPAMIRRIATEPWFGDLWTSHSDVVSPVIPVYEEAGEEASAALAHIGIQVIACRSCDTIRPSVAIGG